MYRKNFLYRLLYAKKTDAESLRNNLNNLKFNDFKNYIVVKIKISHNNSSGADFFEAYSMARQSFFEQLEGTIIMESENCFWRYLQTHFTIPIHFFRQYSVYPKIFHRTLM